MFSDPECYLESHSAAAGLDVQGRRRSPAAVAQSLQRYLLFAILSCVPDRQRTLRELRVGRTLFNEDGTCATARPASLCRICTRPLRAASGDKLQAGVVRFLCVHRLPVT